jgi:DNA-binding NarL/FixJ family response regulator
VAEDDAGWRSILVELLGGAGWRVRTASGFGDALGLLRRDTFDLALVDLTLTPGLPGAPEEAQDGRRLLSITRTARIPTIVLSGAANPDTVQNTFAEFEIFAYLAKQTFDRRAFLETVQAARSSGPVPAGELHRLTDREWEVLELLSQGLTNKEIAVRLVITTNTVKRHLKSIFEKLDIHTRAAAAVKAVRRL